MEEILKEQSERRTLRPAGGDDDFEPCHPLRNDDSYWCESREAVRI
jgi:hypothetical protein